MFRVKICGITNVDDAKVARDAGADAIGLNFFPESPRCVHMQAAARIVAAVGQQLSVVGVFVNAPLDYVVDLADQLPLDFIQLHGDEPADRLLDLAPRSVVRAFRLRPNDEKSIIEFVAKGHCLGVPPAAILVDAYRRGSFGGTGEMANWGQVRGLRNVVNVCPLIMAGGLNPENVRNAIQEAHCDGVDVASGIETAPGKKDLIKTQQFVESAMAALREIAEDTGSCGLG